MDDCFIILRAKDIAARRTNDSYDDSSMIHTRESENRRKLHQNPMKLYQK
jgi:hypothetical protein